jgi:cobalt transporter subunit CbtB
MSTNAKTITRPVGTVSLEKLPAVGFALLLGLFLFLGVGFASPAAIHNAAHDGRHVFSFPCH